MTRVADPFTTAGDRTSRAGDNELPNPFSSKVQYVDDDDESDDDDDQPQPKVLKVANQ